MKQTLLLVFTCCFLFSCQEDFYLDDIEFSPKLVVNSQFTKGSDIEVWVTSSRNVLDVNSQINKIGDAIVTLMDADGNLLSTLAHTGEGRYSSSTVNLEVGKSYSLEVSSDGFETVTASSTIPMQVQSRLQSSNFVEEETSSSLNVDINLKDNDVSDNYYVYQILDDVRLELLNEQPFINELEALDILLTSDDENQEQIATNTLLQSRIFLKDKSFANSEYNISFKAKSNPSNGPVVLTSDVFSDQKLRVVTASKSMYEFYKSVEIQRLRGNANSSITQPIAVYSNVSNGLGIFAGYNDETIALQ